MTKTALHSAAVVVLYRPVPTVVDNIRTWARQVETVYAVDNSETPDQAIGAMVNALGNVVWLPQGGNLGVARALNIGAERAVEEGYDFLLTMDQDSSAELEMVERMLVCLEKVDPARVGIVSPFHLTKSSGAPPLGLSCQEVMTPMTSGCLVNLAAYGEIGPFRDDLFIDFVDNEYCLRLRKNGFRVLRADGALLRHSVGDTRTYGPFVATNHSPLRRYYKTRNRFWVFREYLQDFPAHCLFDLVRLVKEIASIVLFEQEKGAKLRMMWRGWRDFRQGKFGKFEGGPR